MVYILDASTGEARTEAISLNSPVSSSPVLIGNAVIVATESGKIYSLNTTSNQQRLLKDLARKVTSPLGAGDGVVYVHTQEKEALYALNTETGAELWSPAQLSSK
jgi:outer membrane protein assembly factor BamB